ncbi:MAG: PaaI family thioesterase [Phycisphaerales bacterium]|nr:PaaI family thioesterase [Phycisphaerales bacterium]
MSEDRMPPASADWKTMVVEGYPALIGPFQARREGEAWAYRFVPEARHLNIGGVVHGGMLMSFLDDVLGLTVWAASGRKPVTTVQLNTHFISPARLGDQLEGRADVLRATRSVVFVRGALTVEGRIVAAADGVWKILGAS